MTTAEELVEKYSSLLLHNANEAETRLKLIDRIIFEVLGWSYDDVSVEERVSEDGSTVFADYVVRTAASTFVIEAKKVGASFSEVPEVRRRRLNGSLMSGTTGDDIKQARDYCRKLSIPFAVVTNGSQWIIFPASRVDQVRFSESTAIIFPSIKSIMQDDFAEFSGLLSREAVIAGNLELELLGKNKDQFGERRLKNFFTSRGAVQTDNKLYPLIEQAVLTSFTDSIVDSNPELLDKCYVMTPDRRKFDQQIGMYLSKPRPILGKRVKMPMRKRDRGVLKDVIDDSVSNSRPIAVLILGTVGAGKTTFLEHTRSVTADKVFHDKTDPHPHWIYIDFRDFLTSDDPSSFIYTSLRKYILEDSFLSNYEQCIRPTYIDDIRSLKNGPLKLIADNEEKINEKIVDFLYKESEKQSYIDRLLKYSASKSPIFLVIDNVDQFESIELQLRIFSEGIAIAHKNNLNLILTLRDATYVKHRSSPTFDAFDFYPIYIEPPPIQAVLSKRFFLMNQLLKGKSGNFVAENGAKIDMSDLSIVADLIQSSVLGTNIGNVIDVLATSDVRLALRMTREFLESGYSNPGRAIQIYQREGQYVLPRHEALRSVLLGNQPVYTEEFSIIGNPFEARLSKTSYQLLRLFMLNTLVTMSASAEFQYLDGPEIERSMNEIGFNNDVVLSVVKDLCRLRFIHTAGHTEAELGSSYYPSRLGGYIVRFLISDLTFLEAVMMDTFIADKAVWDTLKLLSEEIDSERNLVTRLKKRNTRTMEYFNYMHTLYEPIMIEASKRGLDDAWCGDPFENAEKLLLRNIEKANKSAERHYGKK